MEHAPKQQPAQLNSVGEALDTHQILVTFFLDRYATSKTQEILTLPELENRILERDALAKDALPLLKLAGFGEVRSKNNCLRTNGNMGAISGIEVDYDAGAISFDEAVETIRKLRLRALLYTSPSYLPETKERWRVLLPLSVPHPKAERDRLVSWVNGIFDGKLGNESFVLSQPFYYGSVAGNPEHSTVLFEGDFLDRRNELSEGALGKSSAGGAGKHSAIGATAHSLGELDAMLEQVLLTGDGWHNAMVSVTASLVARNWDDEQIKAKCGPYCWGGPEDHELLELIKSAREKFGRQEVDLGPSLSAFMAGQSIVPELPPRQLTMDDFNAYLPTNTYVFMPTRNFWPLASVDGTLDPVQLFKADGTAVMKDKGRGKNKEQVPVWLKPSVWLKRKKPLEDMTWAPGEPDIIRDRLMSDGGWIKRLKARALNLYRPPLPQGGNANEAGPWIEHVRLLYGPEGDHLIQWLAHRVQHPEVKINHAVLLGGKPGIGKDTILEPVKHAIGHWNMAEISPKQLLGEFNGYGKSVILRISEVRDLGEMTMVEFYNCMKTYCASPPDVLRINQKGVTEYYIPNVTGVVMTTNYRTNCLYLEADDRRHYVIWCNLQPTDLDKDYLPGLWRWYEAGGYGHVAAYLTELDLLDFDPKAPPPKTTAFLDIVHACQSPDEGEMEDVLAKLGNPDAVTLAQVMAATMDHDFRHFLEDRKNRRAIPHRFEKCGYVAIPSDIKSGLWVVSGIRQVIYTKEKLTRREQLAAAAKLVRDADEAATKAREVILGLKASVDKKGKKIPKKP